MHTVAIIGTRSSLWGEGPIWWNGRLIYVDIEGHVIIVLDTDTGEETTFDVGERIGMIVPTELGGFLYAGESGIVSFDPSTTQKINLADPEPNQRANFGNRFNDGKCDPAGRLWAGTISNHAGEAALYMLDLDGSLHMKISGVTNSNGICWSLDATKMYYIDTPTKRICAYDYNIDDGLISNPSTAVDTRSHGYESAPDGMTIDASGKLWVAFCHGGCVGCFDPITSEELRRIDLPTNETTACAFGGPYLDRLFVTTGVNRNNPQDDAGKVFVVDGLGVTGLAAFAYKGRV